MEAGIFGSRVFFFSWAVDYIFNLIILLIVGFSVKSFLQIFDVAMKLK